MAELRPYIVIFKDGTPQSAIDEYKSKLQRAGGTITQTFDSIVKGFAATIPDNVAHELTTASAGGKHEHIEYVEPGGEVKTM
ncbi:hypothetical protein PHSY_003570 [Pseudozyma hubeiensis SY62]|uniref:Inhibitor I9 domain-containing protein n=1 Tax=Pseudozyma hubeiensis (strain SY62) TaxID=1305764 RepID=R9P418_PSEHS|nr:hypothetical protein PHSY_003570 [Pseudozyma hubeiensis SY62]GAC95992.1 hypothetical protein PHSY_003570 [Pseudozyma hubeiensis SY62]